MISTVSFAFKKIKVNNNWLLAICGHHFFIDRRLEASNTNYRGGDAIHKVICVTKQCVGGLSSLTEKNIIFFSILVFCC